MVSTDLLLAIVFYGILIILFLRYRNRFTVQGVIVMLRTKLGLKSMDKLGKKHPKTFNFLGILGVITGFVGMAIIFWVLIEGSYKLLFVPESQPVIAPVLPGITIPGLPTLSFWYWIIGIFIVAAIHEFSHGVLARTYDIKVKSSGFFFLGPILGAFVEPNEKQTAKKPKLQQLAVFAAGPFSNVITGFIFLLLLNFIISPVTSSMLEFKGVQIAGLEENYPAAASGLKIGDQILSINNIEIKNIKDFVSAMENVKPNQNIKITTNTSEVSLLTVQHPKEKDKGYIGIMVSDIRGDIKESVKEKYGEKLPSVVFWIAQLFFWIFILSIGIGLANLLPLGPVDGGRMFLTGISFFIKDEKKARKVWGIITYLVLFLIFINFLPWIIKLLKFIFSPII